jgi:hypothetical protein
MSDKSFGIYTHHSQQPKFRGGEKKVMKKSLSLLLAIALVFSMFSSLAFAADDLTVEQKYEALKAAGIFSGMADGSAGLDQKMTRAQFARVAGLLAGLDVDAEPSTQTFSDVDSKHWAYQEVEAAAAAGLVEGMGNGTFQPSGNVTIQQLAVVAAKILKLDPVEGAEVEGAASWAAPYIKALQNAGVSVPTNYTEDALRADLVNVSYEVAVQTGVIAPEKLSVVSAKAVGAKKVEVVFNKAVDTDKAKLTLKKSAATIDTDVQFADNKKSATLTLKSGKITEGTYTVTLSGVDNVDKNSASFDAQDETVTKIEFVTTSDEIAANAKAKVKLRAENQYGELATANASSFIVNAMNLASSIKKDDEGYLIVTLDTDPQNNSQLIPGVSLIPVYVSYDNNRVTASKTFKLGTQPFATKLELGEVQYPGDRTNISNPGEVATVNLYIYDQYGNPITPEQNVDVNLNAFVTPYTDSLNVDRSDTSNDTYKVKVSIKDISDATKKIEKAATYTLTVYAGSASQTTNIQVGPSKTAMTVKIGEADLLAAGDAGPKYITLDVFGADGNALTPQEIVENASRIKVSVSGAILDQEIVRTGKHKGKVRIINIPNAPNTYVFVTASITTINTNSYDSKQFRIEQPRVPDSILIKEAPAAKGVGNATSDFKIRVLDQYGDEINTYVDHANKNNKYRVKVRLVNNALSGYNLNTNVTHNGVTYTAGNSFTQVGTDNDFSVINNNDFTFNVFANDRGTARFEIQLQVEDQNGKENVISSKYVSIETIDPKTTLYYSLEDVGTVFATADAPAKYDYESNQGTFDGKWQKEVKVVVKDGAGNKVATPGGHVKYVTSSNLTHVVNNTGVYVLGMKAGQATVTATVYGVDGVTRTLTTTVASKADPIVVKEINGVDELTVSNGINFATLLTNLDLKVKDQYGYEYTHAEVINAPFREILGLNFSITDIVASGNAAPVVNINYNAGAPNSLTITNAAGFTLNIVSADGSVEKSVAITVQ